MIISHAMLLAAGYGERLRPYTTNIPKPLLPLAGKPLIEYHVEHLAACGVKELVINVSYLAKQIMDYLGDGKKYHLQITYSFEETPLGAGGGIQQALPLLGEQPFLLISSDVFTTFPIEKFFTPEWHLKNNLLHCVVCNKSSYDSGDFGLENGLLTRPSNPPYSFGSIAIVDPKVFIHQPRGKANLLGAFTEIIHQKKATGEFSDQIHNINTVKEYEGFSTSIVS